MTALEQGILELLQQNTKPFSIRFLETLFPEGNTFEIRDAVWFLVAEGLAEFTPTRRVKIKETSSNDRETGH